MMHVKGGRKMNEITKTRQSFEQSFAQEMFYNRQTQDQGHLEQILDIVKLPPGSQVVDLGTGSGYLAFAMAEQYPAADIIGLDIVEKTLERNQMKALEYDINNIRFMAYDGEIFPFKDSSIDWLVTRYALHHFPDIRNAFQEISRILQPGGQLFLSDPVPDIKDEERFVDRYMQLKDDGHNRFYTKQEYVKLARENGLVFAESFDSSICFPRKMNNRYEQILAETTDEIKEIYKIQTVEKECFITEQVVNLLFIKV